MSEEVEEQVTSMYSSEPTASLRMHFTALVKSKFNPPYLSEEARKGIDAAILEIWQELQTRED